MRGTFRVILLGFLILGCCGGMPVPQDFEELNESIESGGPISVQTLNADINGGGPIFVEEMHGNINGGGPIQVVVLHGNITGGSPVHVGKMHGDVLGGDVRVEVLYGRNLADASVGVQH